MSFAEMILTDSPIQRRAKIVATLGPSSNTEPVIREMVRAGVDVMRLNFSHGSHERKLAVIRMIRNVSREERKPICILGDLQGPKIRTGTLKGGLPVQLEAGKRLTITPREVEGTASVVSTTFKTLAENVEQGSHILLSDGLIELRVHELNDKDVICDIVNGGLLGEHKGINLPGIPVRVPSLTEKDAEDLEFALRNGVDAIAVSFVRTAEDVRLVRNRVAALGYETWIVAKLEKPQAIEHLDSILQASDGIMVARGDLGVEMPPEKVPAVQKHIIRRAAEYRKPVITATQMLESMIDNPRPTRAEVSDVANAVYDGTDAVMLSGETAVGNYPIEAVACMNRIALEAESHLLESDHLVSFIRTVDRTLDDHVTHAVVELAGRIGADAIITPTLTGRTARLIARHRPVIAIVAPTPSEAVRRQMAVIWGVQPVSMGGECHHGDNRMSGALRAAFQAGAVTPGQLAIILAGHPVEGGPHTPTIQFVRVGEGGTALTPT
jgi:pyruvate kinase